jgi:hypothetical protein
VRGRKEDASLSNTLIEAIDIPRQFPQGATLVILCTLVKPVLRAQGTSGEGEGSAPPSPAIIFHVPTPSPYDGGPTYSYSSTWYLLALAIYASVVQGKLLRGCTALVSMVEKADATRVINTIWPPHFVQISLPNIQLASKKRMLTGFFCGMGRE